MGMCNQNIWYWGLLELYHTDHTSCAFGHYPTRLIVVCIWSFLQLLLHRRQEELPHVRMFISDIDHVNSVSQCCMLNAQSADQRNDQLAMHISTHHRPTWVGLMTGRPNAPTALLPNWPTGPWLYMYSSSLCAPMSQWAYTALYTQRKAPHQTGDFTSYRCCTRYWDQRSHEQTARMRRIAGKGGVCTVVELNFSILSRSHTPF
jgi:hypothetical protein